VGIPPESWLKSWEQGVESDPDSQRLEHVVLAGKWIQGLYYYRKGEIIA